MRLLSRVSHSQPFTLHKMRSLWFIVQCFRLLLGSSIRDNFHEILGCLSCKRECHQNTWWGWHVSCILLASPPSVCYQYTTWWRGDAAPTKFWWWRWHGTRKVSVVTVTREFFLLFNISYTVSGFYVLVTRWRGDKKILLVTVTRHQKSLGVDGDIGVLPSYVVNLHWVGNLYLGDAVTRRQQNPDGDGDTAPDKFEWWRWHGSSSFFSRYPTLCLDSKPWWRGDAAPKKIQMVTVTRRQKNSDGDGDTAPYKFECWRWHRSFSFFLYRYPT